MKKGFVADIETATTTNTDYRRMLYTGKYSQLVLMNLKPGEEIGEEVHDDVNQFFRFEEGEGAVIIDDARQTVKDGSDIVVPSGARHNVVNTSKTAELKLYTIYSPPEHQDRIVRKTKKEADEQEEHFDEKATESAADTLIRPPAQQRAHGRRHSTARAAVHVRYGRAEGPHGRGRLELP